MVVPGPYSICQKLIAVSRRSIREDLTGERATPAKHVQRTPQIALMYLPNASQAVAGDTVPAHDETASSVSAENSMAASAATERFSHSSSIGSVESETMQMEVKPKLLEDIIIHIGTIFEQENG
jgi:microcystin-dependent protein